MGTCRRLPRPPPRSGGPGVGVDGLPHQPFEQAGDGSVAPGERRLESLGPATSTIEVHAGRCGTSRRLARRPALSSAAARATSGTDRRR